MKAMINPAENPWQNMQADTARRIDVETEHDFFWITDIKNRYGLLIKSSSILTGLDIPSKMKGISVITTSNQESNNLYLVLNDNKDSEMFFSICTDLVSVSQKFQDNEKMINAINKRLRRWQKFLSEDNKATMPERQQMGLLTELHFMLYSLIPALGYRDSILSWVGPDADKKDFSLKNAFIEVKSFISSRGSVVKVSSLQQLDDEIKPLYLVAYGLTRTNSGTSIIDLIREINVAILYEDQETRDTFENRLASYGYIENVTETPFYTYSLDIYKSYLISDSFPRILSSKVDNRIISVQYSIDLTNCTPYEVLLLPISS